MKPRDTGKRRSADDRGGSASPPTPRLSSRGRRGSALAVAALLASIGTAAAESPLPLAVAFDGTRAAYLVADSRPGAKAVQPGGSPGLLVVSKGGSEGPFEAVRDLAWSPDGKRLVFQAKEKGAWRFHDGANVSDPYDDFAEPPLWSKDGATAAWAAPAAGRWFVHAGRSVYGPFDDVDKLGWTGEGLFYLAKRAGAWAVGLNERLTTGFDSIDYYTESPDGSRRAVIATRDGKSYLCFGSEVKGPSEEPRVAWAADGRTLLYSYEAEGRAWVGADDSLQGPYDEAKFATSNMIPPRAGLWAARSGRSWYLYDGRTRRGPFDSLLDFGRDEGGALHYAFVQDDETYVVTGASDYGPLLGDDWFRAAWSPERREYLPVEELADGFYLHLGERRLGPAKGIDCELSPNRKGALTWFYDDAGRNRILLAEGKLSESFERSNFSPMWNAEGTRCAFTTIMEDGRGMIFDGSAFLGPFENLAGFRWSPGGAHLIFWTLGQERRALYVDGKEVASYPGGGAIEATMAPRGSAWYSLRHAGWSSLDPVTLNFLGADFGPFDSVSQVSWSSDELSLAWKAVDAGEARLLDSRGQGSAAYDDIRAIRPVGGVWAFEGYRDGVWLPRLLRDGADIPGTAASGRLWHLDEGREVIE